MKLLQLWTTALAICSVCRVVEAEAAATVTVSQTSESVYSVSISNVVNAAAIDFVINYDSTALSDPVVNDSKLVTESTAYRELNISKPGVLRVVYLSVNGFKKSGELATVVFTRKGSVPARPPKLESDVFSSEGPRVATRPVVAVNTGSDGMTSQGTGGSRDTSEKTDYTGNMGKMSGFANPSDAAKQTSLLNQSTSLLPDQQTGVVPEENNGEERLQEFRGQRAVSIDEIDVSSAATSDAGKPGDYPATKNKNVSSVAGLKSMESVIDRFQAYKGPRALKDLSELFDDSKLKAAGLEQIPKIAVSDGKKMITVKVSLPVGSGVPSFSLKGANLKGLNGLTDKSLELDVLPQKGKLDVRISIVLQKEVAEIPLLVVPPVSGDILELSDQALENLLSKVDGKNYSLFYDLNADGKQDYLDDYILVAHWQLKQESKKIPAAKAAAPR